MIRRPAVAGQFYPSPKKALEDELSGLVVTPEAKIDAIGAVSPHAGYVYSGGVAGKVLTAMKRKSTYVIIGPNHTGMGAEFSLDSRDAWQTPLGEVAIDKVLANKILEYSKYVEEDEAAHTFEHSIEVQLPFLQTANKDFKFVPIVVSYADVGVYKEIGRAIAQAVKELKLGDEAAIIASSDMTHYEPHDRAKEKDSVAIEAILALDEERLYNVVKKFDITMCGWAPVCIMLASVKILGAKSARLIEYKTSGDVSGDYSSVVGYAGIVVT